MAEENKKQKTEEKVEKKVAEAEKEIAKEITKTEKKVEKKKITQTEANKVVKEEVKEVVKEASEEVKEIKEKDEEKGKAEEKKKKETEKKPAEKPVEKKESLAYGKDLPLSTKHCVAICSFIRGKTIDRAVAMLGEVLQMKKAVPMKGEIPHRKGKIMSGRYPLKASQEFVKLLKQLAANTIVSGLELEKGVIECKADKASRPYKRFGNKRFKRTHVTLKLKVKEEKEKK